MMRIPKMFKDRLWMYRGCSCFCGVLIALVNYGGDAQHPIVSQHVPPWYDGTSRKPQTRLKYAVALSLPIWKQVFTCLTFEVFSIFFSSFGQNWSKISKNYIFLLNFRDYTSSDAYFFQKST